MQRTAIASLLMYAAGSAQGQSSNPTRPGSAGRLGYRVNSTAFPAEVGVARQGILKSYARAGHWVYEERHVYALVAIFLPEQNTEPGHWIFSFRIGTQCACDG